MSSTSKCLSVVQNVEREEEGRSASISFKELFEVWCSTPHTGRNNSIVKFCMARCNVTTLNDLQLNQLKTKIKLFSLNIARRWKSCGARKERFLLRYKEWLTSDFKFDCKGKQEQFKAENKEDLDAAPEGPDAAPRETRDYSELVKRRKLNDLLVLHESKENKWLHVLADLALQNESESHGI